MRAATSAPCTDLNFVATTEYSDYIYMLDAYGAVASTQKHNAQADVRTSARRIPTLRATQSSEGAATGVTPRLIGSIIAVAGGYPIIRRDARHRSGECLPTDGPSGGWALAGGRKWAGVSTPSTLTVDVTCRSGS